MSSSSSTRSRRPGASSSSSWVCMQESGKEEANTPPLASAAAPPPTHSNGRNAPVLTNPLPYLVRLAAPPPPLLQQPLLPYYAPYAPYVPVAISSTIPLPYWQPPQPPVRQQPNELLRLCHEGAWNQVFVRCHNHAYYARGEALPCRLLYTADPFSAESVFGSSQNKRTATRTPPRNAPILFEKTALGILCRTPCHDSPNADCILQVARALLTVCPSQVQCSQVVAGQTPLMNALQNSSWRRDLRLLTLLLEADVQLALQQQQHHAAGAACALTPAAFAVDTNQRRPLDFILRRMHHCSSRCRLQEWLGVLRVFLTQTKPLEHLLPAEAFLSLYRFLSIGSSSYSKAAVGSTVQDENDKQQDGIVEATRLVLTYAPKQALAVSPLTGCTILHTALHHHGNCKELMQLLLQHYAATAAATSRNWVLTHASVHGEWPLHVACAVGVDLDVLQLVLEHTMQAQQQQQQLHVHCPLLVANDTGVTPLDGTWLCYLEGPAFHLVEAPRGGARGDYLHMPDGPYEKLYGPLLGRMTDQIWHAAKGQNKGRRRELVRESCGDLLDRLELLLQGSIGRLDYDTCMLHLCARVSGPYIPCLPQPILELLLWTHFEEAHMVDANGKTPLHYAVDCRPSMTARGTDRSNFTSSLTVAKEWALWIDNLLEEAPEACQKVDNQGRLVLHYALDSKETNHTQDDNDMSCDSIQEEHGGSLVVVEHRDSVVQRLVESFPDSVQIVDPFTHLVPALLAAASPGVSITTVYSLLRHFPSAIASTTPHTNTHLNVHNARLKTHNNIPI